MSFCFHVERNTDEADIRVFGPVTATAAIELFDHLAGLIHDGYGIDVHLEDATFIGLGAVRAFRSAAVRASGSGVGLRFHGGPALYRIADLVGPERWSPLPRVALEDDSVAV